MHQGDLSQENQGEGVSPQLHHGIGAYPRARGTGRMCSRPHSGGVALSAGEGTSLAGHSLDVRKRRVK